MTAPGRTVGDAYVVTSRKGDSNYHNHGFAYGQVVRLVLDQGDDGGRFRALGTRSTYWLAADEFRPATPTAGGRS